MSEELHSPDPEEEESDLDGCDVTVEEEDVTADEDLPPAEGGVG